MKKLIGIMMVIAALTGCAVNGFDPSAPEVDTGAVASAKADGAFGSEELQLGQRATGNAAGEAFALYAIELDATDQIQVTVTRTSGDLNPAAYLYRGTELYIAPDDFDTGEGSVTLNYTLAEGGEHHLVVKAYHGEGAGEFELATECTGGACAGIAADPLQRQSDCIETATQCAIADLPRWNGRVGEVRARNIFDDCLAAQDDETCTAACDGDGAPICDEIVGHLPNLADQPTACHDALTSCLSGCEEVSGYYSAYDLDETSAYACWQGYNGNCAEFIADHTACGGSEYDAGTREECRARCAATEGAWDEGPWDGCMDTCNDIGREHDELIRALAREIGEYPPDAGDYTALETIAYEAVPAAHREEIEDRIADFRASAEAEGRPNDYAVVSDWVVYTIVSDGETVGYLIGIEYAIDDTLFDGGGENVYFNAAGDVVSDNTWWG